MTGFDRRQFLAVAVAVAMPASAFARQAGGWQAKASMPWVAQEIYCAVSGGKIVVVGGLIGVPGQRERKVEDRVALYDPAADLWAEGARLPVARHHPMVVADADGRVFAIGGYGEGPTGQWTNASEVWMLEEGGWASGPGLPVPQAEAVGLEFGGRIHLVTGRAPNTGANGNWNDQADVATHQMLTDGCWETLRPAPMARNSAAGAVLDDRMWVAGGRTVAGGGTGRLDRYDPVEDRWDTLAPIPFSETAGQQVGGGLAMVPMGGRLVAFGGEWFASGGGGVFAETWVYDPAVDGWSRGPDMKTPRHGLAAAVVNGVAYGIGGSSLVSSGETTGIVEALSL